jgi:hypothetical protein
MTIMRKPRIYFACGWWRIQRDGYNEWRKLNRKERESFNKAYSHIAKLNNKDDALELRDKFYGLSRTEQTKQKNMYVR